jgi:hypothetical protein
MPAMVLFVEEEARLAVPYRHERRSARWMVRGILKPEPPGSEPTEPVPSLDGELDPSSRAAARSPR